MRGLDRAGAEDRWLSFEPCKRWAPPVWADDTVKDSEQNAAGQRAA